MATLPDISQHLHIAQRYCYPDWDAIDDVIATTLTENEWHDAWVAAASLWLERMRDLLGSRYHLYETENFLVLSAAPSRVILKANKTYEDALKNIRASFEGLPSIVGYGKHVVLMFSSLSDYYGYLDHFYPDGEHPMSGGIYLNIGYGHMAIPATDHDGHLSTLVHELTHACLRPYPLPCWLDEALAMRMQNLLCDSSNFHLDQELFHKHLAHWNETSIQHFWSGESWSMPDDSFELSYNLAQILWRKIEVDLSVSREEMLHLLQHAHCDDAGESAFQDLFQISLGDLIADFLGEGNWTPQARKSDE